MSESVSQAGDAGPPAGAAVAGGAEAASPIARPEGAVEVAFEVPRLLRDCTDGRGEVSVVADTVESAFRALRAHWPLLAIHVFDETGSVRPHVLVMHNGRATRWMPSLDMPLRDGDRLQILQAVSGG